MRPCRVNRRTRRQSRLIAAVMAALLSGALDQAVQCERRGAIAQNQAGRDEGLA